MNREQMDEAVELLRELIRLRRLAMQRATARCPVHAGQLAMLDYIEEHAGCTQRDLAERMGVSPPSVATSVKRMERAGLIEKQTDLHDLRINRLRLTPLGRESMLQCRQAIDTFHHSLFDRLDHEDAEWLIALMRQMIENAAAAGNSPGGTVEGGEAG